MMSAWQYKLVSVFKKRSLDEELDGEISAHLEMATEEYVSRGMSLRDARLAARRSFGAIQPMKERHRDVRSLGWLDDLARDLRFGLRSLSRSPLFTVTAMLTLALGIGATTAVFTVVNAVLLRPLPYEDPARLVVVHETTAGLPGGYVRPSDFVEYNQHNTVFESLGAHVPPSMRSGDVLSGGDKPLRVPIALVSANLFRLLGVEPIRGRSFDSEEDQPGNDVVIIVSHGLWQRHFGANPEVIGQQIVLSDRSYEVIGVMPPDFELPGLTGVDAWRPWALSARELQHGRVGHVIPYLTGRLKSDATLEQARQELGAIADGLAREYPESHNGLGVGVEPMVADTVRDVRTALLMLFGAVGLVLLLATTNVAAMLVSRAIERQPEMALRRALGGRTWRLVRQLLTEGLILGLVGAAMGVFLGLSGFPNAILGPFGVFRG